MIDALIGGKLFGAPQRRTSKNNNVYVTCKLRVAMGDGETIFANLISFRDSVCCALLALADGSSIAVSGELKVSTYQAKDGSHRAGLDLNVHEILTEFHVMRRRKAMARETAPAVAAGQGDFNDSLDGI